MRKGRIWVVEVAASRKGPWWPGIWMGTREDARLEARARNREGHWRWRVRSYVREEPQS